MSGVGWSTIESDPGVFTVCISYSTDRAISRPCWTRQIRGWNYFKYQGQEVGTDIARACRACMFCLFVPSSYQTKAVKTFN